MLFVAGNARRWAAAVMGAGVVASAFVVGGIPAALADPPPPPAPGCSAGEFELLRSQVAAATADYLFSHPDVNAFFSGLKGQPGDQIRNQVRDYLAGNPQTRSDLVGIRQPLVDMRSRCQ
jgi:heme-binding protein